MKLLSAHIKNFKLLEDVDLVFSTDPRRPLTVIRAENGSGKTSILYALRWAMYGRQGVPARMRFSAATNPVGRPITVQVRVEFTTTEPYTGEELRYRLIRSCVETSRQDDKFSRTPDKLRLLRSTAAGEVDIEYGKEGTIKQLLPLHLANVFFTNGDDVQKFISSGDRAERERQRAVHNAIRQLLGLDNVEAAEKQLTAIARSLKRKLANEGGEKLREATENLNRLEDLIATLSDKQDKIMIRITAVDEQIRQDERELDSIRGVGDLETIQTRIQELRRDLDELDDRESTIRHHMKSLLLSEELSWRLLRTRLQEGVDYLDDLADRKVIPGAAIEVLTDRLELGICICGEDLQRGGDRYHHVQHLIEQQRLDGLEQQHLSTLWHVARQSLRAHQESASAENSFVNLAADLRQQYTEYIDIRRRKKQDLDAEQEKRSNIDVARVRTLTERVSSNRSKRSRYDRHYGDLEGQIRGLEVDLGYAREQSRRAEKQATLNQSTRLRTAVAEDLRALANGALKTLKSVYVDRVSKRMNDLFLEIVGAEPDAETAVFTKVMINDRFDIVIHTQDGKTLDADYELNGASQRALTLSFIWALMQVAGREAPRIIDTPLGMTSGAVKRRTVELLTTPVENIDVPYQVVLLMTRSEIRDLEELLDERAGTIATLSCSKDYPRDLLHAWGKEAPSVKICTCNHRQICLICERRNDDPSRFVVRNESAP